MERRFSQYPNTGSPNQLTVRSYDGDLTISIDPGLDITVPNHQLVVPNYGINAQGQQYVDNSSNREVLIYSNQGINKNDMPALGLSFFTSAYIMVDEDHQQFTLWKSQPSTTQNLVALRAPVCDAPSSTTIAQPSSTAAGPSSSLGSGGATHGVSKGAESGIILGSLAGVALLLGTLLSLRARRQGHRQRKSAKAEARDSRSPDGSRGSPYFKPELPSDTHPPQELPLERDSDYALAPFEMSGDVGEALDGSRKVSVHELKGGAEVEP